MKRPFPERLGSIPGDIVVALSDAAFISFSMHWSIGKGLVAIKSGRAYPLTLPNVARNVIAHELGHAIRLAHNSDPAMLNVPALGTVPADGVSIRQRALFSPDR